MRIIVLGAGISGHTAATLLKRYLGKKHEIVVISPNSQWNWIPSNIWVGVGAMKPEEVTFPLKPVYEKMKIRFLQAKGISIHPEGDSDHTQPFVTYEFTSGDNVGKRETIHYDFCINATGPKLNFGATPGLGPDEGFTHSVCTYGHAEEAARSFKDAIRRMKAGETLNFVIGTGHGTCTCQGAAFEYLFNIDYELRKEGVRDKAKLLWLSNEYELGDFGMGGMHLERGGYITSGKIFAESLFAEREVQWKTKAHVTKIEKDRVHFITLDGEKSFVKTDFTMLIPPFAGVGLKSFSKSGEDITEKMFAANGMMKVDANYNPKGFEEWDPDDWPKTYQSPFYPNVFAIGIAFAPPHPISKIMKTKEGIQISPTPPRTGMPSATMGKAVAKSIADRIRYGKTKPTHTASMAEMGAACVASAGKGFFDGGAASMTIYPIVPDYKKYPKLGRSLRYTTGEIGLAGHWIKMLLHSMFLYKAKGNIGWWMIPE
ncbi:FAD-dependent oxidoreductase [Leptospira sp. 201903070]|uniref:FAD-dependent oxidoreductase n=1 Tax=Leptospira ainlahdjerensis TaxID=2810033 RepID=A0ABS2U957_9LEPT|nr:FAD-dependent oxidoreductase [Leptospira ainlahdjerensis]MBM9576478.1 FAD-dependent oxidoreductase [Leptospira ainlahdjerensis]